MGQTLAEWKRIASDHALKRSSHTFSVVGNRSYIFGGELQPREPRDNAVYRLDLEQSRSSRWTSCSAINNLNHFLDTSSLAAAVQLGSVSPSSRLGTASAVVSSKIYIYSGRGGTAMEAIDDAGGMWCLMPDKPDWKLLQPRDPETSYPPPRSYHCTTSDHGSKVFIHAGCPASGRLADLWAFDVSKHEWKELASAPGPPRGGTSITYLQGKIYRMGGFDGKNEIGGAIDCYDVDTDTWSTHEYKADGLEGPGHRSVAVLLALEIRGKKSLVTMFGESDPSSLGHQGAGKMLGDAWVFDIQEQTWSQIEAAGEIPPPRGWFDADVLRKEGGDAIVVQGGLGESNDRLDDAWVLDFI